MDLTRRAALMTSAAIAANVIDPSRPSPSRRLARAASSWSTTVPSSAS